MIVDCAHWRDGGKRDGGCCTLLNRSVSRGVCRHCAQRTGDPPPASPNLGDPRPDAVRERERGCGCEAPTR
jgi:hypothetical protein